MPTLRSVFLSSGWPRQTEHVTTLALPSASSFSCQRSLIAEVIRLGKAALKIKVSHVSQHFCLNGRTAFEGSIHEGRPSAALSSSARPAPSPLAAGEDGTKERLHFTENDLVGFLGETRRSELRKWILWGKFWSEDVQSLIISNSSLPPRGKTLYFFCDTYFQFFLVTLVSLNVFFCVNVRTCCVCVCVIPVSYMHYCNIVYIDERTTGDGKQPPQLLHFLFVSWGCCATLHILQFWVLYLRCIWIFHILFTAETVFINLWQPNWSCVHSLHS